MFFEDEIYEAYKIGPYQQGFPVWIWTQAIRNRACFSLAEAAVDQHDLPGWSLGVGVKDLLEWARGS